MAARDDIFGIDGWRGLQNEDDGLSQSSLLSSWHCVFNLFLKLPVCSF